MDYKNENVLSDTKWIQIQCSLGPLVLSGSFYFFTNFSASLSAHFLVLAFMSLQVEHFFLWWNIFGSQQNLCLHH